MTCTHKIFTSPLGDIKNLYSGNAAQFMRESPNLKANLEKTILIDAITGDRLTSQQFFDLTGKIHHVLLTKYGINYDDVVCLITQNSIHVPAVQHGILSCGAIVSPTTISPNKDDLNKYHIRAAGAKLVVTVESLKNTAMQAAAAENVRVISMEALVKEAENATTVEIPVELENAVEKVAYYLFSSGTSGMPKCVQLTHQNITANSQAAWQVQGNVFGGVFGAVMPMTHSGGMNAFVWKVLYGAQTNIVFPSFDLELLLPAIGKYKITSLHVYPPMVLQFAKSPMVDKHPVNTCFKRMINVGAPLSEWLVEAIEQRIGAVISQAYGLSECLATHYDDANQCAKAAVGWLLPGQEARVVDDGENDVETNQQGELYVRGPSVMKGYLNNQEATTESITHEGWLKTGDIVVVDETEQFYIVDRVKDVIKTGSHSYHVAPAELEGLLLEDPAVADCAVIGVYSEDEACELPRAFIVTKDESSPLEIKQCYDRKVPRQKQLQGGVVEVDTIPKNLYGKVLRRELRGRNNDIVHGMVEVV